MAYDNASLCITMKAGADLSSSQYLFVECSAADTVTVCNAAGERAIGVLQNDPTTNGAATVAVSGVVKVKAGAAVSANALVKTNSSGKAITAAAATVDTSDTGGASDPVVGSYVMGIALNAASADGDIISVLLTNMGAVPTTAA